MPRAAVTVGWTEMTALTVVVLVIKLGITDINALMLPAGM